MSALVAAPPLTALPVEHLVDLAVDLEPAQVIPTPRGTRTTLVVRGGTFSGPGLRGEVLPGGGDWLLLGSDGVAVVDVRATLRTDEGELIHLEAGGLGDVPPEELARLAAGARVAWDAAYIRTTPRFATGSERLAWLNRVVAVAYNELAPDHVDYRVYRVR
ncbi:MAG: DUF3237 domain-containing protein [Solirubrobacterales bacterium]|nr:DUF3237 domain-containing protein [Solirubrobacterales bacterium]